MHICTSDDNRFLLPRKKHAKRNERDREKKTTTTAATITTVETTPLSIQCLLPLVSISHSLASCLLRLANCYILTHATRDIHMKTHVKGASKTFF